MTVSEVHPNNWLNDLSPGEWVKATRSWIILDARSEPGWKELKKQHPGTFPIVVPEHFIPIFSKKYGTVLDPFAGCYDKETEVLTRRGWLLFKDLAPGDEFLTRTLDGQLEYHKATAFQRYHHTGDMIRFKGKGLDLRVTPDHNMLVKTHADFNAGRPAQFIKASDLSMTLYRIPSGGRYQSEHNGISPEMMFLCGIYLADGHLSKGRGTKLGNAVFLSMIKERKTSKVMEKLSNHFTITKTNDGRKLRLKTGTEITAFIKTNCGQGARNKFISQFLLSGEHLDELFEGMMLGDGHVNNKTARVTYYTSSKKLADDFQDLSLKLGHDSTLYARTGRPDSILNGRIIRANGPSYEINIRKSSHRKIMRHHASRESYDDEVFCVTVPNHTLFVRRNGCTAWCGNSGSTMIAASRLDRYSIGIDLQQKYADIFKEIMSQHYLHPKQTMLRDTPEARQHRSIWSPDFKVGDSIETMREVIPAESIDYIFTSPPYSNILRGDSSRTGMLTRHKKRMQDGLDTHYSEDQLDLGNAAGHQAWLLQMINWARMCAVVIKPGRFMSIVIQNLMGKDYYPLAWELAYYIGHYTPWRFAFEMLWLQSTKPARIHGHPSRFLPSNHHHYVLNFQHIVPGAEEE